MRLFMNMIALVRGVVKCALLKCLHGGRMRFHASVRILGKGKLSLRNRGSLHFGKNIRIAEGAMIAANGGQITLENGVGIGKGNMLISQKTIHLGAGTILGPNVLIFDHDHLFDPTNGVHVREYVSDEITIGKNCWIGANSVILRGTHIGDNCLVAAGSVIKGSYPDGSKIIQKRETIIC